MEVPLRAEDTEVFYHSSLKASSTLDNQDAAIDQRVDSRSPRQGRAGREVETSPQPVTSGTPSNVLSDITAFLLSTATDEEKDKGCACVYIS